MGVVGTMNEKLRLESDRVTPRIRCFLWARVKISFSDLKKCAFHKFKVIEAEIFSHGNDRISKADTIRGIAKKAGPE